ncbi:uncharacterized protein EAF02_009904 [Botrytis sinoallii]|uniref:uncharacterized protein n=1 Tax=Botrytis sinoallii TaxID=1463999 RepID=UPI0019020369|nr:uncharacterized protein EAF02_009904 [Botrytis sinoallii]KAF7867118.1 hypothetical protein EAF02_009904 [Botrytis sinoallii]
MSTFALFNSFPPEIHSIILEQCPPNDRTCLRLTCKYLYTLSPPEYPVSLDYSPTPEVFCSKPEVSHISPGVHKPWRFPIRKCGLGAQLCHDRSLHYINILRAAENLPPLTRKKCQDHYWGDHCECFSRSKMLHKQLQKWMPKDMKYCGTHGRKKQYNRNSHIKSNLWTNHKGRGGYYHKLWKKEENGSSKVYFSLSSYSSFLFPTSSPNHHPLTTSKQLRLRQTWEARLRLGKRDSNPLNLRKE